MLQVSLAHLQALLKKPPSLHQTPGLQNMPEPSNYQNPILNRLTSSSASSQHTQQTQFKQLTHTCCCASDTQLCELLLCERPAVTSWLGDNKPFPSPALPDRLTHTRQRYAAELVCTPGPF